MTFQVGGYFSFKIIHQLENDIGNPYKFVIKLFFLVHLIILEKDSVQPKILLLNNHIYVI
jgi:hypothetical protein